MGVAMLINELTAFDWRTIQACRMMLAQAAASGAVTIVEALAALDAGLDTALPSTPMKTSKTKRRTDTIVTCSVCGKSAVIVPLSRHDRTGTATHAIQCQNRPAKDQPWRDGMCGHTEYIMRGEC